MGGAFTAWLSCLEIDYYIFRNVSKLNHHAQSYTNKEVLFVFLFFLCPLNSIFISGILQMCHEVYTHFELLFHFKESYHHYRVTLFMADDILFSEIYVLVY